MCLTIHQDHDVKKTKKAPSLPIPDLTSGDTIAAFLAAVPPDTLARFPDTIRFLEGQSAHQQVRMQEVDLWLRDRAALARVIKALDPASPASIDTVHEVLRSQLFRRSASDEASIASVNEKAQALENGMESPDIQPTQAALPAVPGLPALVDFFKKEALAQIAEAQANLPSPGEEMFGPACYRIEECASTFLSLHGWKHAGGVSNIFGVIGAANQASNILRSLINNPDDPYPWDIGYGSSPNTPNLEGLVEKIQSEADKCRARQAIRDLSPAQTLRAVELLKEDENATTKQGATSRRGPR